MYRASCLETHKTAGGAKPSDGQKRTSTEHQPTTVPLGNQTYGKSPIYQLVFLQTWWCFMDFPFPCWPTCNLLFPIFVAALPGSWCRMGPASMTSLVPGAIPTPITCFEAVGFHLPIVWPSGLVEIPKECEDGQWGNPFNSSFSLPVWEQNLLWC